MSVYLVLLMSFERKRGLGTVSDSYITLCKYHLQYSAEDVHDLSSYAYTVYEIVIRYIFTYILKILYSFTCSCTQPVY